MRVLVPLPVCAAQRGASLIMLMFILTIAAMAYLATSLSGSDIQTANRIKTATALAQAKAALIGWSVGHASMPGALPCPDNTNSGSAGSCSANTALGRLPWKTLGIGDLRDDSGECLWYALSPVFRNTISVSTRGGSQPALNSTTSGSITLLNKDGTAFASPVIAVIFAPGAPLTGQDRDGGGSVSICGGNTAATNYLDTANNVNNATGNHVSGNNYTFTMGDNSSSFNDRLIYITAEDLYQPLRKRIAAEIDGTSQPTYGLVWYYNQPANHSYPWAADATGTQQTGQVSGYAPNADLNFSVASLNQWLTNNGWFSLIRYQLGTDFQPGTTYPQQCGSGCLMIREQQAQAAVMIVESGVTKWTARVCATNSVVTSCPLL